MVNIQQLEEAGHARRMGPLENYFAINQRHYMYTNFVMVGKFNTEIKDDIFFQGLSTVLKENPILLHTIAATDRSDYNKIVIENDYMYIIPKLRYADIWLEEEYAKPITDLYTGTVTDEMLHLLNKIILPYASEDRLTWRLLKLDEKTYLYITNHCASDAVSATNFFKALAVEFNKLGEDVLPSSEYIFEYDTSVKKLPRTIDTLVDYDFPKSYLFQFLASLFAKAKLSWLGTTTKATNKCDNDFHFKHINISHEKMNGILSKLKSHVCTQYPADKLTMTPYLEAAWGNALYAAGMFERKTWWDYTKVFYDMSTPINSRQYLNEEDQEEFKFGANVGGTHFIYLPDTEFNWSTIEYHNAVIRDSVKSRMCLWNLGMMLSEGFYKRGADKQIVEATIGGRRGGTIFSNAGFVNTTNNNEKYQLDDLIFSQSPSSMKFSFNVNCCGSSHGGLNIVIAMSKDALPESTFHQLCQIFEENICEGPRD